MRINLWSFCWKFANEITNYMNNFLIINIYEKKFQIISSAANGWWLYSNIQIWDCSRLSWYKKTSVTIKYYNYAGQPIIDSIKKIGQLQWVPNTLIAVISVWRTESGDMRHAYEYVQSFEFIFVIIHESGQVKFRF